MPGASGYGSGPMSTRWLLIVSAIVALVILLAGGVWLFLAIT